MERQNEKDAEIENKEKMLIKDMEEGNMIRTAEQIDHILNNLQPLYQSLYGCNDYLATLLKENFNGQEEKDGDLPTSSSSDFYLDNSSEGGKRSFEDLETRADQLKDENSKSWIENARAAGLFQGLDSGWEEKMPLISKNAEISDTMEQDQGISQELIEKGQQLSQRFNENEADHSGEALSGSSENEKTEKLHLEKCRLKAQVADLKLEVSSLLTHKGKLEAQIKNNSHEAQYLREENQLLQLMTRELHNQHLGRLSSERVYEISSLLKKLDDNNNEGSAQIMALTALVKVMQGLDNSHSQKIPLEMEVAGEREEAAGRQTQETKNIEFTRLILDMQNLLKEREDEISKLTIEYKQLEDLNQKSLRNSQEVDKKIRHTEELYQRNMVSRNEMIGIITRVSEKEKKRGEYGKQLKAGLKTQLENMKANQEDLQVRHKSKLDKLVALIEKQRQTIEQLGKIHIENQREVEKVLELESEVSKGEAEEDKLLNSVALLLKQAGELVKTLRERR